MRPSRLQLPALLATIQAAGAAPPTSPQARELMDKVAALYEGIRIGTAEMRGLPKRRKAHSSLRQSG